MVGTDELLTIIPVFKRLFMIIYVVHIQSSSLFNVCHCRKVTRQFSLVLYILYCVFDREIRSIKGEFQSVGK
jgi:hypothetical protein